MPAEYSPRQRPVLSPFTLCEYDEPSQYLDGAAEFPGYWAEDRIFGGVVLFERNDDGDENEVWYHSHRKDITKRIYALTSQQKLDLYNFLRAEPDELPSQSLLPILGNRTNGRRVDAEIAIPRHNIYRDRWERKIKVRDYNDYRDRRHCVITALDYPELGDDDEIQDWLKSVNNKPNTP